MLDFVLNIILQGATFGVATLGVCLAFRICRYPDLTADGSFILGACVFSVLLQSELNILLSIVIAILAGAASGAFTGIIGCYFKVNRLLSGILTSMIAYSVCFRVMNGRSNVGVPEVNSYLSEIGTYISFDSTLYVKALMAIPVCLFTMCLVYFFLRTELGLILRASGENPELCEQLERRPALFIVLGLALSNALIAFSGILVTTQLGFADINMSVGLIITLIAGLVLGEEVFRIFKKGERLGIHARIVASILGMTLYYFFYLVVLKASINGWLPMDIQPTDLKLVSAIILISIFILKSKNNTATEVIPI